jgi:hypothetical protein
VWAVVVTAASLPPVIPTGDRAARTVASPAGAGRQPPPLPELRPAAAPTATVYALSAIDRSGRLADRSILRVLDWPAGLRLDICERAGVIAVRAAADGAGWIDARGFLQVPLTVRRWCRLSAGDRLLLAADPATGVLLSYPGPVLDALLAGARPDRDGDGAGARFRLPGPRWKRPGCCSSGWHQPGRPARRATRPAAGADVRRVRAGGRGGGVGRQP